MAAKSLVKVVSENEPLRPYCGVPDTPGVFFLKQVLEPLGKDISVLHLMWPTSTHALYIVIPHTTGRVAFVLGIDTVESPRALDVDLAHRALCPAVRFTVRDPNCAPGVNSIRTFEFDLGDVRPEAYREVSVYLKVLVQSVSEAL